MATKLAQAQLAELPERVGILETKVENINEKLGEVKDDIKEMHDCLDNTRDRVLEQLDKMTEEYRTNAQRYYEHTDKLNDQQSDQHKELAGKLESTKDELHKKIKELETVKDKWMRWGMVGLAFLACAGWIHAGNIKDVIKLIGL